MRGLSDRGTAGLPEYRGDEKSRRSWGALSTVRERARSRATVPRSTVYPTFNSLARAVGRFKTHHLEDNDWQRERMPADCEELTSKELRNKPAEDRPEQSFGEIEKHRAGDLNGGRG